MRIAFIGAGNIAPFHLQAIRLLGAEVVGVCTRSDRGRVFAEENRIPHFSPDARTLVKESQAQAVMLLAQPSAYPQILSDLKPLNLPTFLEKPLSYTVQQAEALRPLLPDVVFVGLNRRFYGNIQQIMPLLQASPSFSAELVMPERLKDFEHRDELTRHFWPMMNSIHGIDLMTFLAGAPTELLHLHRWNYLEPIDEMQYRTAVYQTEHNHTVTFLSNLDSPGGWRMHFFLAKQEVIVSPLEKTIIRSLSGVEEVPVTKADRLAKPGFLHQMQTFLEGAANPKHFPAEWVSFDAALQSMRAVELLFPKSAS